MALNLTTVQKNKVADFLTRNADINIPLSTGSSVNAIMSARSSALAHAITEDEETQAIIGKFADACLVLLEMVSANYEGQVVKIAEFIKSQR